MKCAVCNEVLTREDAPILAMGGYGTPRCMCDECAADFDIATLGTDFDEISAAVDRISTKMAKGDPDNVTVSTVSEILSAAGKRASAIKDGTYDFEQDSCDEPGTMDELPEELEEDPDDVLLDEQDKEKERRFDKVFNVFAAVIFSLLGGFLIYKLLDMFLF